MINIAEILKECPTGTKLYSPIFGDMLFQQVTGDGWIKVENISTKIVETFYPSGQYSKSGEYMLFPSKDNRDWNTFQRPFKDGDIVSTANGMWIGIIKRKVDNAYETYTTTYDGAIVYNDDTFCFERLATEYEKQKLFDAIKSNGYKWNAETLTLEKLIEPKFKVGDKIQHKITILTIIEVQTNKYIVEDDSNNFGMLCFSTQDNWELVPNKFDISTLKPFDKVLVRTSNSDIWECEIFSSYDPNCSNPFHCTARWIKQCIPFEDNEHLLGTSNDCNEYYKTW